MPLDTTAIPTRAVLKTIYRLLIQAMQQSQARACGRYMFEAKELMNQYGLNLETFFEAYFRSENNLKVVQEDQQTEPEQTEPEPGEEEDRPPYPGSDREKYDPTTPWVVPWAERMDQLLQGRQGVEARDWRNIHTMQELRTKYARSAKEILWLKDICNKYELHIIPAEYYDWWNSLPPHVQLEAKSRPTTGTGYTRK